MKMKQSAKKALLLGMLCTLSYLAVYIARNMLSAVTPQMIDGGFSEEYIGSASSLYFISYALGQLINGVIGDRIKAKYMISFGLFFAAVSSIAFSLLSNTPEIAMAAYACSGFFLSMIYAPMVKVVTESTEHIYAVRTSVGYTFASFFGSPMAGMLASFLAWQSVFAVGSSFLVLMSAVCFISFIVFERKGIVRYGTASKEKSEMQSVKVLLKHQIVKFSLVALLSGIVRTSVVFWLPTYISQHLGFSAQEAAGIFTAASLAISFTAFIAIFVYERIGRRTEPSLFLMFSVSFLFFILTFLIKQPFLNIIFIVLAIMGADGASSILWSVYCPSLKDTGRVSGATGFLDFLSYMAAAGANLVFANAVSDIGWGNLLLVWSGIAALGVVVSLPWGKLKKNK